MHIPHPTPIQKSLFVLLQVESQLSDGAHFILGRMPGGTHVIFCKSGHIAKDQSDIFRLMCEYTSKHQARSIWGEHVRDCSGVPESALVLHAYGPDALNPPSEN